MREISLRVSTSITFHQRLLEQRGVHGLLYRVKDARGGERSTPEAQLQIWRSDPAK